MRQLSLCSAATITDFNNAIDRDPFAGAPYQARGQSLMAAGKYEAAIEDFNAALSVNSNNSDAWAGLGAGARIIGVHRNRVLIGFGRFRQSEHPVQRHRGLREGRGKLPQLGCCAARSSAAAAGSPGLRRTIRAGSSASENSAPPGPRTRIERSVNSGRDRF
jgi:tetratricopeptide (TPR) repeat protein